MKKLLFVILLTICIIWNGFAQHKVRHHSRLPLFTDPFISMITLKSTEVKLLTATRISFTPHLLTPKKAGMFFTKIVEPQAGHVQSDQDEIDQRDQG